MDNKHILLPDNTIREFMEYARLGVLVTNAQGDIINANETLLLIMNLSLEAVRKMKFADIISLVNEQGDSRFFPNNQSENLLLEAEIRIGERFRKSCYIMPIQSLVSLGIYMFIVTFAVGAEDEMLYTLARSHMLGNLQQGYVIMNCRGKIVDINEYAAACYGFTKQELLFGYKKEKLRGFTNDYFLGIRTLESGIPFRDYIVSWKVNDKKRSFIIDTIILRNDKKEQVGVCVLIRDITNIRSVELQIQHNERLAMIAQIAAGAAHEIKNPITSVRGFLQILRTSLKEHKLERELEYTEVMIAEIDRVWELLDEFLLLSKPKDLRIEKSKPKELLDHIAQIIQEEARDAGISVKYQIDETPYIKIDKELIQQVLLNIIRNAIDAMADDGELLISVDYACSDQVVRIQIKDTGPGIPAYMIDKIFDPFFTTKATGTGLGLAVCQRIVNDHGGNIRVVSKGHGTIFVVNLPVSMEEDHGE